jgi:hypothetical protein
MYFTILLGTFDFFRSLFNPRMKPTKSIPALAAEGLFSLDRARAQNDNWLTTGVARRPKVVDKLVSRERSTVAVPRNHRPQVAFSLRKCHLARLPERARELWNRSRPSIPYSPASSFRTSDHFPGIRFSWASGTARKWSLFGDWPGLPSRQT